MKGVLQLHWDDAEHRVAARMGVNLMWEAMLRAATGTSYRAT